jgi:hypothetical protein
MTWRKLFQEAATAETFKKAEVLLAELNPESPLRLRLTQELEEIRKLGQE